MSYTYREVYSLAMALAGEYPGSAGCEDWETRALTLFPVMEARYAREQALLLTLAQTEDGSSGGTSGANGSGDGMSGGSGDGTSGGSGDGTSGGANGSGDGSSGGSNGSGGSNTAPDPMAGICPVDRRLVPAAAAYLAAMLASDSRPALSERLRSDADALVRSLTACVTEPIADVYA